MTRARRRGTASAPVRAKVGRAGARKTPIQLLKEMGPPEAKTVTRTRRRGTAPLPPEAIMEKRKTAEAVFFGFCGAENITPRP